MGNRDSPELMGRRDLDGARVCTGGTLDFACLPRTDGDIGEVSIHVLWYGLACLRTPRYSCGISGAVARPGEECMGYRVWDDCMCDGNTNGYDSWANSRDSVLLEASGLLVWGVWLYTIMVVAILHTANNCP